MLLMWMLDFRLVREEDVARLVNVSMEVIRWLNGAEFQSRSLKNIISKSDKVPKSETDENSELLST